MNTRGNNDWFDKLTYTVSRIINANSQQLSGLLSDSHEWNKLAKDFADKNEASDKDIEGIVRAFKKYAEKRPHLKDKEVDYNYCLKQINFLLRQISKLTISNKNNQFSYETPFIKEASIAWLLVLIAYINLTESNQSSDDFANTFIKLTTSLDENAERNTSIETIANSPEPLRSKINDSTDNSQVVKNNTNTYAAGDTTTINRTLILVFGQSQWTGVSEIKNKTKFNDSDYELLKKYEWFWYGESEATTLAKIPDDKQGNMCWLQLDVKLKNVLEVKNRLHFMELIDKIKKEQVNVTLMKVGGLFQLATSGLSDKGFIKA